MSNDESLAEYQGIVRSLFGGFESMGPASPPMLVAEVIYEAVTDGTDRLRYAAGDDAAAIIAARTSQDDAAFIGGIKAQFGL